MVTALVGRAKTLYRENLHEPMQIRRIVGSGPSRTDTSWPTFGRLFNAARRELTGGIAQQDRTAIICAQPLLDAGMPSDVRIGDFLIDQDGVEHTIYEAKARRIEGVMIGYELTVRA